MKKSIFTIPALAIVAISLISSCSPIKRGEYASGSAIIYCDDGFKQILEEEIAAFEFSYPEAAIIPKYVSEGEALDSLLNDEVQAVIVTRELNKQEIDMMKSKYKRIVRQSCIAVDAVALIINKDNPVDALSVDQISDILNGKIKKWSQLAGNDTTAIKLVFDNAQSSTVSYLRNRFLPEGKLISDFANSYAENNNAEVFDVVKKDKNALGVISVSWLGTELEVAKNVPIEQRMESYENENDTIAVNLTTEVKVLKVSNPNEKNDFDPVAYMPYQVYINSGEYPLFRKVFMITTSPRSSVLNSFYVYVTGFVGQKIISKSGILPYKMAPRVVEVK